MSSLVRGGAIAPVCASASVVLARQDSFAPSTERRTKRSRIPFVLPAKGSGHGHVISTTHPDCQVGVPGSLSLGSHSSVQAMQYAVIPHCLSLALLPTQDRRWWVGANAGFISPRRPAITSPHHHPIPRHVARQTW